MSHDPEGRFRDIEAAERPTFKLLVRLGPRTDEAEAMRGLRWLLKRMWRSYGVECLSVTPVNQEPERR